LVGLMAPAGRLAAGTLGRGDRTTAKIGQLQQLLEDGAALLFQIGEKPQKRNCNKYPLLCRTPLGSVVIDRHDTTELEKPACQRTSPYMSVGDV